MPSWEKKYCSSVGSFPWRKLLENKRFIYLYDNVLQWNDSAGEEAFRNAKNRFWAQINGLPCDIALPDPDIYIDKIDWDCSIDPELLLDLEREPVSSDDCTQTENVSSLGNSLLMLNQPFSCNGWGDCEAPMEGTGWGDSNEPVKATGWGDWDEAVKATGWGNFDEPVKATGWVDFCGAMEVPVWKDDWNNPSGWNQCENLKDRRTDGEWGRGNWNSRGEDMSRYRSTRLYDNDYQADRGWRSGGGRKRTNFAYDGGSYLDKKTVSQRRSTVHYCGPVSHHGAGKAGNSWSWKKPVA